MTRSEETLSTRDIASPPPAQEEMLRDGTDDAATTTTEPAAVEETAAVRDPAGERDAVAGQRPTVVDDGPLLPDSQGAELQTRWEAIQVRFVDDPRNAVEEADALVAARCSSSPTASPTPARTSRASGAAARTSPPRTCASRCSATARSSGGSWPLRRSAPSSHFSRPAGGAQAASASTIAAGSDSTIRIARFSMRRKRSATAWSSIAASPS